MNNESVYLIAGGNSLRNFDFNRLKNKDVIAINKSILDVPFAQRFITMDYTFVNEIVKKTNYRLTKEKFYALDCIKYFVVAVNNEYIKKIDFRKYTDTRNNYIYDLNGFQCVIEAKYESGIGSNITTFTHGRNSGFCALQLAITLGYKNIYLLGYDLEITHATHYHNGYNQDLNTFKNKVKEYYLYFVLGLEAIKYNNDINVNIYSCSEISKLNKYLEYYPLEDIK